MTKQELQNELSTARSERASYKRIADDLSKDRNDAAEMVRIIQDNQMSERNLDRVLEVLSGILD